MSEFHQWLRSIATWSAANSEIRLGVYDVYDVNFIKSFGPWKKGAKAYLLSFTIEGMTIGEFALDTTPGATKGDTVFVKSVDFVLTPVIAVKKGTLCQNPAFASEGSSKKRGRKKA